MKQTQPEIFVEYITPNFFQKYPRGQQPWVGRPWFPLEVSRLEISTDQNYLDFSLTQGANLVSRPESAPFVQSHLDPGGILFHIGGTYDLVFVYQAKKLDDLRKTMVTFCQKDQSTPLLIRPTQTTAQVLTALNPKPLPLDPELTYADVSFYFVGPVNLVK